MHMSALGHRTAPYPLTHFNTCAFAARDFDLVLSLFRVQR